jgi:hypothetical protein
MIRLRRASAIAALCVLASAETAHAECVGFCGRSARRSPSGLPSTTTSRGCFGYSASVRQWPKTRTKLRRCRATNNRDGVYRQVAGSASPTPWTRESRRGSDGDEKSARSERTPRRAHLRPAGFLEVRHDVAAAPLAVASLRRRPLMDSATIYIPAIEDHVVLALADKFHVVIGAWFRT